ncbi:hypothetical protein CRYUN_Cryun21dG0017900 [Craigia yunnanensis]
MAGGSFIFVVMLLGLCLVRIAGSQSNHEDWKVAHATFYGDMRGTETMKGACGYGDLIKQGYGLETTAFSIVLFNNGLTCGACYEIRCHDSKQWCLNDTIIVTATNFCSPNYSKPEGNWCNPPWQHFDLSQPMFRKIALYRAGIVPVMYKRVPYINPVVLGTTWIQMSRNWGQNWQTAAWLIGQSLSFRVTTSDGKMVQFDDVAPADWKFGGVYEGKQFPS